MPLILLGLPKFSVCAVEPVQDTKHPETLVEPVNRKHQEVLTMFYKQESRFKKKIKNKTVFPESSITLFVNIVDPFFQFLYLSTNVMSFYYLQLIHFFFHPCPTNSFLPLTIF